MADAISFRRVSAETDVRFWRKADISLGHRDIYSDQASIVRGSPAQRRGPRANDALGVVRWLTQFFICSGLLWSASRCALVPPQRLPGWCNNSSGANGFLYSRGRRPGGTNADL